MGGRGAEEQIEENQSNEQERKGKGREETQGCQEDKPARVELLMSTRAGRMREGHTGSQAPRRQV